MTRRSWLPLAVVMLVMACASMGRAADEVRDGAKFNSADPGHRIWVKRWADSASVTTPKVAGTIDSAVIVYPAKVLPLPVTVGAVFRSDTSSRALTAANDGSLYTSEYSKDRDLWNTFNLINNQLINTAAGISDSNATPIDTHAYKHMALMLYGGLDSLSGTVRIAVEVRAHVNSASDSASAYPWYRWPVSQYLAGTTAQASNVDSLGHMRDGAAVVAAGAAAGSELWPGEFMVVFKSTRDGVAIGTGTYGGFPKGIYLPLYDATGAPYWAPYTSVRVRVISGIKSRFKIRVDLVGSGI